MTQNTQAVEAATLGNSMPELNFNNYTLDEVHELQQWAFEAATCLQELASRPLVAAPVGDEGLRASFEQWTKDQAGDDVSLEGGPFGVSWLYNDHSTQMLWTGFRAASALAASRVPLAAGVVEPVEFRQFLTDVVAAAGLLSYGRQDKVLSDRISNAAYKLRTESARREPVAWAVYLVSGQAAEQKSVFFSRGNAEEMACTIKGITEIRPLYPTPVPGGAGGDVGVDSGFSRDDIDAVAVALTGDEGDDDSLTVLRRLVATLKGRTVNDLLEYIDELKRATPAASVPAGGEAVSLISKALSNAHTRLTVLLRNHSEKVQAKALSEIEAAMEAAEGLASQPPTPQDAAPAVVGEPIGWRDFLLDLEWSNFDYDRHGEGKPHCPSCGNEQQDKHTPDCKLAAFLAATPAVVHPTLVKVDEPKVNMVPVGDWTAIEDLLPPLGVKLWADLDCPGGERVEMACIAEANPERNRTIANFDFWSGTGWGKIIKWKLLASEPAKAAGRVG